MIHKYIQNVHEIMGAHSMNVANLGGIETLITNADTKFRHICPIANLQYVLIGRSDKTKLENLHFKAT